MHIGKQSKFCPTLKIHGTLIHEVTEELYLDDLISSDGKNTKNIKNRISKGIGIISQIMNILESTSFGPHYFEIAMLLRESLLVNGVTTNAEVWHNITESEMSEFESLDKLLYKLGNVITSSLRFHQIDRWSIFITIMKYHYNDEFLSQ